MTGQPSTDVMDAVAEMFAASRQRRAARADTAWRTLRPYERRVVREAAVMGYVLDRQDGMIRGRQGGSIAFDDGSDFPKDSDIVQQVLEHCDSTNHLYPWLAAACDGRRRRITKARQWPGEQETTR